MARIGGAGHGWGVAIPIPGACRDLLALQSGVVGRQQALQAGLREDAIRTLLRTGRWQLMQRGVYAAFTGEPGRQAVLWSVLLRIGPDAILSHQTAAELFGLASDIDGPIHVIVPRGSQPGRIPGVVTHRVDRARDARHPSLLPPRTKVEETVLDLAVSARSVEDACGWIYRATGKWLTTPDRLRYTARQRPRLRWHKELLSVLDDAEDGVRSNLEHHYVRGVERPHGLPPAARQVRVLRDGRPCYLDNLYEKYLVGIELDGRAAHPAGERFRDFRRDNMGAAVGIITLRYGWTDVTGSPCRVAGQVADVLAQRGWDGAAGAAGPRAGSANAGRRVTVRRVTGDGRRWKGVGRRETVGGDGGG